MGCASSNETPPIKATITKKSKFGSSPAKSNKSDLKNSRSPSINSRISQKGSPTINAKDSMRSSSLKNIRTSTNSVQKTGSKSIEKNQSSKNLRSSQRNLPISQSKIKLEVKEIIDQNEQDMGEPTQSYKKLRKTKKKKVGGDPRMGQMVKIYGM